MTVTDPLSASDLAERKLSARREAAARRKRAAERLDRSRAAETLADRFLEAIAVKPGQAVSGFLPIGSEIDVRPLLARLAEAGVAICLPAVIGEGLPLQFRRWREGDALVKEPFGTLAPAADATVVEPDIVLTPGLAFDAEGYRLGYGGGFYDRTLAALRRRREVKAVGVAYEAQRVAAVPRDTTDLPVDMLVTEVAAHCFDSPAGASSPP